jgi:serine/threonine protein kinase
LTLSHIVIVSAGGDLRDAMSRCTTDELCWDKKGCAIAVDVARALVFLHANRVVHADLKSQNILLTKDYGKRPQMPLPVHTNWL